mmetsp:Transcript_578/g.651  ORF Transcript_578/g.651 Transcript_578/m.651 type:complete len:172 (+) Transcript_578:88-603(+)
MTESQKKKLFKVFDSVRQYANKQQYLIEEDDVKKNSEKKTSGNGLGLYLSLQLAQYLNGDIHVESEPQHGTTIKVIIMADLNKERVQPRQENELFSPRLALRKNMSKIEHKVEVDAPIAPKTGLSLMKGKSVLLSNPSPPVKPSVISNSPLPNLDDSLRISRQGSESLAHQ